MKNNPEPPDQIRDENPPMEPVLEKLSRRVEQTLGIRATADALEKLREDLERRCGPRCFEAPGFFDRICSTPEEIFTAARLLTVNETYFFREEASFELLRRELLPRLTRQNRPIRVCSAASSIGCEAYSLAMVMDHYSRTVQPFSFGIDAFDVNPEAVETAKRGQYTGNSLREDGSRWKFLLDRYTFPEGDEFVIRPLIREQVHFYTRNLLDGLMGNRYDLIFFRNALIYFSPDKRRLLLDRLTEALYRGGFLILGVSETPAINHPLLESRCTLDFFYFQAPLKAPPPPPPPPPPEGVSLRAASLTPLSGSAQIPLPPPPEGVSLRAASLTPLSGSASLPAVPASKKASPGPSGLAALIDDQGGACPIAPQLPDLLRQTGEGRPDRAGDEFLAGVIYLLGQEEFSGADKLLSYIERHANHRSTGRRPADHRSADIRSTDLRSTDLRSDYSAFTAFLRGEYHYFNQRKEEAEASYREAAEKNSAFWPAFYRLSALAAEGNPVQYEYKTR
ncbi:MAG: chemotaxis protein CheR, partial [Spirochaetaceae bacterium]|nr:chemotaxis protein CheR [Spirochaetaceae bacterium]